VKPGRNVEANEKIADESSQMKQQRPLSPNLSDFVVVPENFSFDSSGTSLSILKICHILYFIAKLNTVIF